MFPEVALLSVRQPPLDEEIEIGRCLAALSPSMNRACDFAPHTALIARACSLAPVVGCKAPRGYG
jgi:hypothetical protein